MNCRLLISINKFVTVYKSLAPATTARCYATDKCVYLHYCGNKFRFLSSTCLIRATYSFSTSCKMADTATDTMRGTGFFKLSDYDCIGFDLDNTVGKYKITSMVKLEYEVLANFLIREKGYSAEYLLKPVEDNLNFLQKGLVLDFDRGNVLQLRSDGVINKATHGTRFLEPAEITDWYGEDHKWDVTTQFCEDMLVSWNGPLSEKMRTLLDYFDMPASLIFARIIDSLDAQNGCVSKHYKVWPDVLDGLIFMFRREAFEENAGDYFPALKSDPQKYVNKCSPDIINWLKTLKQSKITFLITGSNVDYASFTASNSLGENWRELFDIVVCYARKPGFFTGTRPFLALDGIVETKTLSGEDLELGNLYSQGNWQDLLSLLSRSTKKKNPKCVYIGDNLIQDVYTPAKYTGCDTVALVEELAGEGMIGYDLTHPDSSLLAPNLWGSYFVGQDNKPSLWSSVINKYSKICIPNLEVLANQPLDFRLSTFADNDIYNSIGYYPGRPSSFARC